MPDFLIFYFSSWFFLETYLIAATSFFVYFGEKFILRLEYSSFKKKTNVSQSFVLLVLALFYALF